MISTDGWKETDHDGRRIEENHRERSAGDKKLSRMDFKQLPPGMK
jgi:hypothetical protein